MSEAEPTVDNSPNAQAREMKRRTRSAQESIYAMKERLKGQAVLWMRAQWLATFLFGGPAIDAELLGLVEEVVMTYLGHEPNFLRQVEQEIADKINAR